MRTLHIGLIVALAGCGGTSTSSPDPQPPVGKTEPVASATTATTSASATNTAPESKAAPAQKLTADTPSTTVGGHTFIAPNGWTLSVKGNATIVEAPEGDSRIVFVDVKAKDADSAVKEAWAAYRPDMKLPLRATTPISDKDGWQDRRNYVYQTSPNERRGVVAGTRRHGDQWLVSIFDVTDAVGEKRGAQITLIFGRLFPKGYSRESFAGKKANALDAARIKELSDFVERGQKALGIPGVSIGLVQDGKVVFTGGFGVRDLDKPAKVDADTLYIIASNTKAMTTMMLGKLVDEKKLTWDTPVTKVLPDFKLGDADTTSRVLVKHLICACTGLPRQDLEWLFEFKKGTPASSLVTLGTMQPTTKFGELYQYSNPLAAAGGFVGGHVAFPTKELGAAYDEAMKTLVFDPLGMKSTTFDFKRALKGNHAGAHGLDIDGKPAAAVMDVNYSILPVRPAGGAWSSVNDVVKYVQMELAKGMLPNGKRYASEAVLKDRQTAQVTIGKDAFYGMGLITNTMYGTPVVQHGGSMIGYKSQMFWLPEHNVGAVILTNADPGGALNGPFVRKLLEVLFNGNPEADNDLAVAAKAIQERIAAERKLLTFPPDKAEVDKLAAHYTSTALGDLDVVQGDKPIFDFGEFKSPVASRKNPDGTVSFLTTVPGFSGIEMVVGNAAGKRSLVVRDAQHEYTFTEK
ncbi:MAG TPA: serine hydrolase domain-containing protein [Polyangium sp.]|nr:serine hydrolase domain-containing protein [Polyangium sp.]